MLTVPQPLPHRSVPVPAGRGAQGWPRAGYLGPPDSGTVSWHGQGGPGTELTKVHQLSCTLLTTGPFLLLSPGLPEGLKPSPGG